MSTKVEVRIYAGSNLHFADPTGIYEASVTVQQETTTQSVGLPKNAARQTKNKNPAWNKALYFDVTDVVSAHLIVQVIDMNDVGQQAILGKVDIPLNMLSSVQNGIEVKHLHPLQTGGEIEVGLIPTHGVQSFGGAAPPTIGVESSDGDFKRAATVGPFALKKRAGPTRGVLQYAPGDLQRIFPHLARGTYGIVFRGKAKGIPDYVVIKDMEIQNQNSVVEWQKEIDIMARTKSPYIAEVFGFSSQGNVLTIVMEFMCNGDLFGVLHKKAEKHPLSLIQRMRMARHSALGLQVLHSKGFLHRDIKSMNILVDKDYTCKMTDFGCSKMIADGSQMFNTVNTGTPLWMAPEVKQGIYGYPSDIYSLGLVLFEIFEKRIPDFDPNTQRTSLPKSFQSAPVVLPCVNPLPHGRPTIAQVIERLDMLIRGIVSTVQKILPPEDLKNAAEVCAQLKKDSAAEGHPLDPTEAEQAALYQVLQDKPMAEADALCIKAGISVGISGPPQSTQLPPGQPGVPHQPITPGHQLGIPQLGQNSEFLTPSAIPSNHPEVIKHADPPPLQPRKSQKSNDPHILIVGASHLKSADLNGLSDPYAKIYMNGVFHKTEIKKKTLDPTWNYKICTKDAPDLVELQIDVWDWDKIGSHDYLGYASLPLLDTTKADDMWIDLLPRSKKDKKITGKIHIQVIPR